MAAYLLVQLQRSVDVVVVGHALGGILGEAHGMCPKLPSTRQKQRWRKAEHGKSVALLILLVLHAIFRRGQLHAGREIEAAGVPAGRSLSLPCVGIDPLQRHAVGPDVALQVVIVCARLHEDVAGLGAIDELQLLYFRLVELLVVNLWSRNVFALAQYVAHRIFRIDGIDELAVVAKLQLAGGRRAVDGRHAPCVALVGSLLVKLQMVAEAVAVQDAPGTDAECPARQRAGQLCIEVVVGDRECALCRQRRRAFMRRVVAEAHPIARSAVVKLISRHDVHALNGQRHV